MVTLWILNYFFFLFHTSFTIFNIIGFFFKKTRMMHLITMLLTIFSWFILGLKYGIGYCFCTDWHWQVREKLGIIDSSNSYIHFLVLKITRIDFDENLVFNLTMIIFFSCLLISLIWNVIDLYKKKKSNL